MTDTRTKDPDLLTEQQNPLNESASDVRKSKPIGNKRCIDWIKSTYFLLYCSHFLSAWGDRMWQFATGMFLVTLNPNSLQLTAIYGFTSGGSILFMGAIVGHWVDKYKRITVARAFLLAQNLAVAASAIGVCFTLYFTEEINSIWGGGLKTLCHTLIIAFAVVADVASMGRTISIERDWIVLICPNEQKLTNMSATLRRIDLSTKLLAPVLTGQVITYGSTIIGAIFIAAWNLVSVCVEYVLLHKVYVSCPQLKIQKSEKTDPEDSENEPLLSSGSQHHTYSGELNSNHPEESTATEGCKGVVNFCVLFFNSFITLFVGWKLYIKQRIFLAGIALSTLYMTVLGFDNITTGFAKEQGLTESVISILMAAGAIVGITGTFVFPRLRSKIGLTKTGMLAMILEVLALTPCVLSIWLPGSPFDPGFLFKPSSSPESPCIQMFPDMNSTTNQKTPLRSMSGSDWLVTLDDYSLSYEILPGNYLYSEYQTNCTEITLPPDGAVNQSLISVLVLMAGIVFARFGLWMADLTVTQLLLETPPAGERGKVNGVQSSLNQMMDMIKFLLVIFLPWPPTFGILILISFGFIISGFLFFSIYACKEVHRKRKETSVIKESSYNDIKT